MIARVVLTQANKIIDKEFDYEIPDALKGRARIGMRVLVPFGRQKSGKAAGIICDMPKKSEFQNLKQISDIIGTEPMLKPEMLDLCRYMKERYLCPLSVAVRAVLPPEPGEKNVLGARLLIPREEAPKIADGLRAKRAEAQAEVLTVLADEGEMTCAQAAELAGCAHSTLRALEKKGLIEIFTRRIMREAFDASKYNKTKALEPTKEQKPIIEHINSLIDEEKHETVLIHGVTGSGKTEVFLQTIEHCVNMGKTAIVLVPEISLTPQMIERFVSRLSDSVAVMHSRLSFGERFDQWQKILRGEVSVVVGARSAVFAPLDNIGIIILDEEHEASYKSENAPRYHARDIALWRARTGGAPVVLASATPSVESFYRARSGEYTLCEMKERYNQNELPKSEIVDMRAELFDMRNNSAISFKLQDEINKNLQNGEKTILFLNRRGYNTFVSCRECGAVMECKNCSIPLTYHMATGRLKCHYCEYTAGNITVCPECGSKYIRYFGTGTQKIEEELHSLFPSAGILRMDYDTTSQKGGHEKILREFRSGGADILLGTQMVAKGLDIASVTLVGVLAADASLGVDDFRASERTFDIITQVCGRAGRGSVRGRAVIQTYQPQNKVINMAKNHDYVSFFENEIKYRKRLCYPPFCDIISILISGEDEEKVRAAAEAAGRIIKSASRTSSDILKVLGPAPAPIYRIKGRFRYRILIKAGGVACILPLLDEVRTSPARGCEITIDYNPNNMN